MKKTSKIKDREEIPCPISYYKTLFKTYYKTYYKKCLKHTTFY